MRTGALGISMAAAALVGSVAVPSACASSSPLIVNGRGISQLHLGSSESNAVAILDRLLGRPTSRVRATPIMMNCGVDALGDWHALSAYFDRQHLVGLAFGEAHVPTVQTVAGLKLGDSLARARSLYGHRLTTSEANGGAWYARTPTGRIDGFLNWNGAHGPRPTTKIITIDVGVVGCPAMSP